MPNAFNNAHQSGEYTRSISVTPTVQAAAYANNDLIGGKMTIPNAARYDYGTGRITDILLASKTALTVDFYIIFFNADPTNTTFTENAALDISVNDIGKICGAVLLDQSVIDVDLGTPDIFYLETNIPFEIEEAGRDLYACLKIAGAHTPASTSDIIMRFAISQD